MVLAFMKPGDISKRLLIRYKPNQSAAQAKRGARGLFRHLNSWKEIW